MAGEAAGFEQFLHPLQVDGGLAEKLGYHGQTGHGGGGDDLSDPDCVVRAQGADFFGAQRVALLSASCISHQAGLFRLSWWGQLGSQSSWGHPAQNSLSNLILGGQV